MPHENIFFQDVEATVEVGHGAMPERILFAFPGLEDPVFLWDRLRELGWEIPERPEHPPAEIDWNSPGGSKYQVVPYRVEDFIVTPGVWPADEVAERALDTVNLLRRVGVDLHVSVAYLALLRRSQVSLGGQPRKRKVRQARVPRTLLLSKQPFSFLLDYESIDLYETATGPRQANWYWAESAKPTNTLVETEEQRDELMSFVQLGWELDSAAGIPQVVEGRDRTLRFLVQDMKIGASMTELLKERAGEQCGSLLLRPIDRSRAFDNCLLVVSAVRKEKFAEVGQTVIDTFPDAIGRGRRFRGVVGDSAA